MENAGTSKKQAKLTDLCKQGSQLKSSDDDYNKYLIGARGYITEHLRFCDDGVMEGVELLYSDGTSTKCGKCGSKKMSEVMPFGLNNANT